ncbi:MAG TPA: beta-ketoacyl-ACP synthase II [Candidatus Hydrogenedentes bacterium]|nr:beta-ketoacyl-ACP synthase II [Candidatus Hydrogenedentota bacterium]HOL78176.1 beta-ketoacyl-ACP synthase II [Candidatus Hydrogenedentota bacterium]HPO86678.1 beta-ketoacyl-ACP synthase II [Candidatus Hydrogenedentota bacterium]
MRSRVVITGMGVVSPVGNDVETFWKALIEGKSGIGLIRSFDASDLPVRIAGECEDCYPANMSPKDVRRRDRYTLFALYVADQAWKQAGLDINKECPERCGVVFGSGIGGLKTIEEQHKVYLQEGPSKISPLMLPKILSNMAAGEIAIRLGLRGPNKAVVTACASGTQSITEAANNIRCGQADVMLAGASEAGVVPFGIAGFAAIKALSRRNDEPQRASRPFDLDRDGFVMGEGAGILVLESEEHARARGAEILGEVAGYGETCDAYHVVAPRPDGSGAAEAMKIALKDAGLAPEDVDYFNAHGTSTKYNDISESLALRTVFGDNMPLVSSTKSMIGHLLGAAGAVEAIACVQTIRTNIVHPSINYDTPDPECPVNIVANVALEKKVDVVMSNSLGFGGHNASIILKRYE